MKQLIQNFKTGELGLQDIPAPSKSNGAVLVENSFSLISAGTEKSTVSIAKQSLVGKAKAKPELVKQVMANIRKEGLLATFKKVQNKLDMPKALGYSSSGIVVDSGDYSVGFKKGERVACAGQDYASHAEIVTVPQNLVVRIPDKVSLEEASFTTIGAIAMQGIRQADLKVGEKVGVIGLGLIGQITGQIAKACGCSVFGLDISDFALSSARLVGLIRALKINDASVLQALDDFTCGVGLDKVIISASASDNSPIVFATEVLRKKGIIVIVGQVKMDIPRDPHFYRKELSLKIATSYGPGRYDPMYEEAGIDYPLAYVRFTENRNMQSFLELIASGSVKIKPLITHVFDFNDAVKAYDLILNKKENYTGILLKYRDSGEISKTNSNLEISLSQAKQVNVGFVGAGSHAQGYLLPFIKNSSASIKQIVDSSGVIAASAAKRFQANQASTDYSRLLNDKDINTVFIATRHNTHADYVSLALKAGKNVFVEKPLALDIDQLKEIISFYKGKNILLCGFNRRFSALSRLVKSELDKLSSRVQMNFRVNAGVIPKESWIHDLVVGGGRIIGEVCHFIDLASFFANSLPSSVYALSCDNKETLPMQSDNISIAIGFPNGSSATITYLSKGSHLMEKERLEIFCSGSSFVINDFKEALLYSSKASRRIKGQGKGHDQEISEFIQAVKNGGPNPIKFESMLATTLASFKVVESLKTNVVKSIDINELYT